LNHSIVSQNILTPARSGSLYYLGIFLTSGSYGPFLYVYYAELGLTGRQIGFIATLYPLAMLLFATAISSYADRKRQRVRIAQLGLVGLAISVFCLQFPTTFIGIILVVIPMSIFASPVMSIADSLIARMARRHNLNYGSMRLWGSIGYATGALTFGVVWQRFGFDPMFLIASLAFLPVIWITGKLEETSSSQATKPGSFLHLFRDTGLVFLLVAIFLAGISNSLSMTFEGIYVHFLGGGSFLIGMMTAFSAFAELPTMNYSQRIAQRLRGANAVILAFLLMAVAYLGYMLVKVPTVLPWIAALKGVGFGLFLPNAVRILNERAPEEWASTTQSFMTVGMFGLAPLIAGPVGGWIHDAISPSAVFALGSLTLGLAALVLWFASIRGDLT
jgi:PPP family 3-phenylpropionic acid transporter